MPRGKRGRAESLVHEVAGSFDQRGQVACILCGKILVDYSDAQIEFDGARIQGGQPQRSLPPGPVTVTTRLGDKHPSSIKIGALFGVPRCTETGGDAWTSAAVAGATLSGSRITYEHGWALYRAKEDRRILEEIEHVMRHRGLEIPPRPGLQPSEVEFKPPYYMTIPDLGGALLGGVFEDTQDVADVITDIRDTKPSLSEGAIVLELKALSHAAIESGVRVFVASDEEYAATMEAHYLFLRGYLRDASKVERAGTDWGERLRFYFQRRADYAKVIAACRTSRRPADEAAAVFSHRCCGRTDAAVMDAASRHFSWTYRGASSFLADIRVIAGGWEPALLERLRRP